MVKKVKHSHKKSHKHKKSKFSLFKHRVADAFKEIVDAPPEVVEEIKELIEPEEVEEPEQAEAEAPVEEFDEKRDQILQTLNSAVESWKETGDIGMHLEEPKKLRDRVHNLLVKMKKGHSKKVSHELDVTSEFRFLFFFFRNLFGFLYNRCNPRTCDFR